jgi:hypothetical protein
VTVDSVKKIFNEKANGLNDTSSDRSLFLDNERYDKILLEVKEAQILRKNNQELTSKHCRSYELTNSLIKNTCNICLIKNNGKAHLFLQELLE